MFYKVWSTEGHAHFWQYDYFREEVKGTVVESSNTKNVINFIIYKVEEFIDDEIFDRYYFDYIIMPSDYTPPSKTQDTFFE